AVAVLALVFVRQSRVDPAITYSVGPEASEGTIGAWIAAGSGAIPLRFSEGTAVTLEPGSRARVTGTNAHGATMLVERGHAHAKVVHVGQTTSWLVHAGPFDVNVVGTEFDVAWDPTLEVFDLRVTEGKVVVRGPLLDTGRAISANEVLRVDVHHQASEMRTNKADAPQFGATTPPSAAPTNQEEPSKKTVNIENVAPTPVVSAEKPLATPAWQKLAAAGKHREALEAAEQAGFETILANSSASALLDLADEARFAGSPGRAKQALLRAREMGARGRSAFLLGKLAADHDRAPADALTWFQRYLEESPSGGLAEQAWGRIVEIEDKLGHVDEARKAAQSYLQRYPGGAYETLARRVVEP
ncbi:MAG TPA: tetratricopeptide repeat protein, partial [Polyangium sp.]|nr:tetratricopeptide repeat protein [Polyangium sp.]